MLRMDKVIERSAFAGTTNVVSIPLPSQSGNVLHSMCITFMVSVQVTGNCVTAVVIKRMNIPILRK